MGNIQCGLIYVVVTFLIGWYIWFRKEGRDEIRDVLEEDLGLKGKSKQDESQLEYQKWWNSLSESDQEEIIQVVHNPSGIEDEEE